MQIKSILKSKGENSQTFFNFLSTVISSGIAFITMPIFTRMLGTEQYGLYSIYHAWLTIFICFMGFNVSASFGTGYYKYKDKYYEYRSSVLVEGTVICLITAAVFVALYPLLGKAFGYSITIFLIMLAHAFATFTTNVANGSWVYEKKAARNMAMSTVLLVSTSILSIWLLASWKSEAPLYYGRVIGTAFPHIAIAIFIWILIFKEKPYGYKKEYWAYGLSFGLPMVFHMLSQQVLGQSDRIMMQWFPIPDGEIGIYSFFYSFVAILTTILNALNTSWCPFLYDGLSKKSYDALNKKVENYAQLFVIMSLGFLLLARDVMKIFANSDYWSGAPLVPILVLVVYFTFIYQFAVNYEFFNEKPKYVAIGTVIAAITNIILNAVMIPRWGMYGAAIATLLSYIALAVMHTVIVNVWKLERYPLKYGPVMIGLVLVMAGCGLYYLMGDMIIFRWIIAAALGLYLIRSVYKRKTIF